MTTKQIIEEAIQVIKPKKFGDSEIGMVGCALITDKDTIFKGVCIHTVCGMGFCAEHTAIGQMVTQGEYKIKKIVAVYKNTGGEISILAPCGRCREFMYQTNEENLDTDVVLDINNVVKLKELLPYHGWCKKIN
tara:strand:+ start:241 stop:642 length:402 start_codon:yes stop_codon:yes gene_type:complete